MSVEDFDCIDDALLWHSAGLRDDGLSYVDTDVAPTPIKVRETVAKANSQSPDADDHGTTVSLIVDRLLTVGDMLWLGSEDDLPGTAAIPTSDFLQVVDTKETKDVKGRNSRYRATCRKHSNTLPVSEA